MPTRLARSTRALLYARACASGAALALALALALASGARAAPVAGDHAYELHARLVPERHRVDGRARIRWRNTSAKPVHELVLHLYANAFAHTRTVFMREQGAAIRGGRLTRTGGIDVTRLALGEGTDLLPRADRELIAGDATQMRVSLPAPVHPGQTIELLAEFRLRLPSLLARMGASGDFFMIAQWFPKLARLEPDGRWAAFPYHGLGEFYADFAHYELVIETPQRYAVAAPGRLAERSALAGGMRRERYVLDDALDVAWAAYPDFRRIRTSARGVRIDVFAPPGSAGLARRQAALIGRGLARLGARLGPYPHERLVLVLPPGEGRGAFGMEYPGLLVGAVATWYARVDPTAEVVHDLVTAHELAHQWFPMLAASNEVEAPWLDEGLAEWLGLHLIRDRYGPRSPLGRLLGLPLDVFLPVRAAYASTANVPSSLRAAHEYTPGTLAAAVYLRPALVLEAIRMRWGERRLWCALGRHAREQRFAHPVAEDLFRAFDRCYWPGFAARVLRPALSGEHAEQAGLLGGDRETAAFTGTTQPGAPLWSRALLWALAALGVLGP